MKPLYKIIASTSTYIKGLRERAFEKETEKKKDWDENEWGLCNRDGGRYL
jgi:hypothetical protein